MKVPLAPLPSATDRLLTFEVGDAVYALPISSVLEVAEANRVWCVPTLTVDVGGVMNWHGESLPLVSALLLLAGTEADDDSADEDADIPTRIPDVDAETVASELVRDNVLVISNPDEEVARLGLPVNRVIGLVDSGGSPHRSVSLVVERRPVDGRVVHVLDPNRLIGRAERVIENAVA